MAVLGVTQTTLFSEMTAFWDVAPCSLGDRPDDGGNKQF
jgi:hypothetical protein